MKVKDCPFRWRRSSKLHKALSVCLVPILLVGCAGLTSTTMSKGVRFGMSPQRVQTAISSTDQIKQADDDKIISEGTWEMDGTKRRKTFIFKDGKLDCVRYERLADEPPSPIGSVTNCR